MPPNSHSNTQSAPAERQYAFRPIESFSMDLDPDAAVGEYTAVIEDIRVSQTKPPDNFPMLIVEWKLEETTDESDECQKSIGATTASFITFKPSGAKFANLSKLELQVLLDTLGIDHSVIPSRIMGPEDFDELVGALKGQRMTIWITPGKEGRTNVKYSAPKGSSNPDMGTPEEPPAPAAKKTNGKALPAKGNKRR